MYQDGLHLPCEQSRPDFSGALVSDPPAERVCRRWWCRTQFDAWRHTTEFPEIDDELAWFFLVGMDDAPPIVGCREIGDRVSEIRSASFLTQSGLAESVGVHELTITRLERGLLAPTGDL